MNKSIIPILGIAAISALKGYTSGSMSQSEDYGVQVSPFMWEFKYPDSFTGISGETEPSKFKLANGGPDSVWYLKGQRKAFNNAVKHGHQDRVFQIAILGSDRKWKMPDISPFTNLKHLWIGKEYEDTSNPCNLKDPTIDNIPHIENLESLYINVDNFEVTEGFLRMTNLKNLWIKTNQPINLGMLSNLDKLQNLVLQCDNVSSLESLEKLQRLKILKISIPRPPSLLHSNPIFYCDSIKNAPIRYLKLNGFDAFHIDPENIDTKSRICKSLVSLSISVFTSNIEALNIFNRLEYLYAELYGGTTTDKRIIGLNNLISLTVSNVRKLFFEENSLKKVERVKIRSYFASGFENLKSVKVIDVTDLSHGVTHKYSKDSLWVYDVFRNKSVEELKIDITNNFLNWKSWMKSNPDHADFLQNMPMNCRKLKTINVRSSMIDRSEPKAFFIPKNVSKLKKLIKISFGKKVVPVLDKNILKCSSLKSMHIGYYDEVFQYTKDLEIAYYGTESNVKKTIDILLQLQMNGVAIDGSEDNSSIHKITHRFIGLGELSSKTVKKLIEKSRIGRENIYPKISIDKSLIKVHSMTEGELRIYMNTRLIRGITIDANQMLDIKSIEGRPSLHELSVKIQYPSPMNGVLPKEDAIKTNRISKSKIKKHMIKKYNDINRSLNHICSIANMPIPDFDIDYYLGFDDSYLKLSSSDINKISIPNLSKIQPRKMSIRYSRVDDKLAQEISKIGLSTISLRHVDAFNDSNLNTIFEGKNGETITSVELEDIIEVPSSIFDLNLNVLYIENVKGSKTFVIPEKIMNMTNLTTLSINRVPHVYMVPTFLAKMPMLTKLSINTKPFRDMSRHIDPIVPAEFLRLWIASGKDPKTISNLYYIHRTRKNNKPIRRF